MRTKIHRDTHPQTHTHTHTSHLLVYTAVLRQKSIERCAGHGIKPLNARTMHILYYVMETRCVCVCVRVCVFVHMWLWGRERNWEKKYKEKRKEVDRERHEALSLRLHKTKSTVMSLSCVFVSLHVAWESTCLCVCRILGSVLTVCTLQPPQRNLWPLFSYKEKEKIKRKREKGELERQIGSEWRTRPIWCGPCTQTGVCMLNCVQVCA